MKKNNEIKKVVLAYSGGLDTSITIPWLKENYGCEVIAVVGNVGQDDELEGLEEKAIQTGASKIFIEDLTDEFVEDFVFETLKAGAKYEGKYLLGTSFARPVIAKRLVEIAHREGADAIAHGCTGKGNDQVRFELAVKAFDPDMEIIAPWRTWELKSREDEIEYAKERNIPLPMKEDNIYSEDRNIWHVSHEGLDLEYPDTEPNYDNFLKMSVSPENAPNTPTYVTISFEKGIPVAVNGEKMSGKNIIKVLNKVGGENGVGIDDIIENRLVGMKVRGVYENPGGAILYKAHEILESITLDGDTQHYKDVVSVEFANVVYNGKWFSPLREALSAFVNKTQETVTGEVKLKLYKGNIINAGVTSPYSLYNEEFATFGEDGVYDQHDSQGFVNLYSLSTKVQSMMKKKLKNNSMTGNTL
ncbi:argininosuccinate synthase [Anaerosphaera multitolerans]|uniref:Argininosuccinate synthase n=1 Tax=Anaerosphaera multitolerans TaxID=2487351 RepID=A0A437S7K7_9FIRM|nr:argininosuccinate synthase [Anaerosphaera multitolerans]RVU54827.1 argininosuccinate synthase [Anaerosphaera multitolerans]